MSAATIGTTNSQGALLELVARGNKDAYFFQDDPASVFPFQNNYKPQTPFISEVRYDQALNAIAFGRVCEIDFVIVGDILADPTLLLDLPTWLPPSIAAQNRSSRITDASGISYGYTNGIGYFLFERIQLFQDNYVLQEWSGDALYLIAQPDGTLSSSYITAARTGQHNGSDLDIQHNAAPPRLRLPLPIVGTQAKSDGGLPQRCLTGQRFKLKLKLRRLEDCIEASDARQKPIPWGRTDFQIQVSSSSSPQPFTTLSRTEIHPPRIQLETTQIYLPKEYQQALLTTTFRIPFTQIYENQFSQTAVDYAPIDIGASAIMNRRIDYARHPTGRLFWAFRSRRDLLSNKYIPQPNPSSIDGSYYQTASLYIAGQPRELPRNQTVWRDITVHAKGETDVGANSYLSLMDWTRGSTYDARREMELSNDTSSQPTGTINFTTADRPTLQFLLQPTDPKDTELLVITEGWAEYTIQGGRGSVTNAN